MNAARPVCLQFALGALGIFFAALLLLPAHGHARPEMAGQTPETRFAAIDKDGNGKLDHEEFFAAMPQMKEPAFEAIDADKDGLISLEEWKTFTVGHGKGDPHTGMGGMPGMGMPGMGGEEGRQAPGPTPPAARDMPGAAGTTPANQGGQAPEKSPAKAPALIMPADPQ